MFLFMITWQIEKRNIQDLRGYDKNPRRFTEKGLKDLKESLKKCGDANIITINADNTILGGHARLTVMKQLGYKEVDVKVPNRLLNEQEVKEVVIRLNANTAGEWDLDKLEADFNLDELQEWGLDIEFTELEEEKEIVEDEVPEEVETRAKLGDIWQLGEHRLMCGDSTSVTDVEKLMNGTKADMVFTDPPYNIAYSGVSDKRSIMNDKMSDDDFVDFLCASIPTTETAYICCSWQYAHLFKRAMELLNMPPKSMIIWNKVNPAQHLDKYFKQHEIIWYFGKFGGEKTLRGDIWECKRQRNTVHPTMKPIELISMALSDQPNKKTVYDGFGGSGSTLIACEQLNRKCFMMELDPHYCDVIIQRWENLTGKKAVLCEQ